jgi:D-tyrosyl-tRNA(Tyr) deacylase
VRALLQRVAEASVSVEGETVGGIGPGLLILACAMRGDEEAAARRLAAKAARLRIFRDEAGRMNHSLLDAGGAALVVSQFTLAADTGSGLRPGFSNAAPPEEGRALVEAFAREIAALGAPVERGRFGADMRVALVNDGPVTIWLEG